MESKKKPVLEHYGPLNGIRVLLTGQAVAGPAAGRWLSDMGAEVIHVERPGFGDLSRSGPRTGKLQAMAKWSSLARNRLSISFDLNFKKFPESKEIFTDLIRRSDVWINNVPDIGKKGPSDELVLEINPKITIVHVTGFGLRQNGGIEDYLGRPSFDIMAQAFSGYLSFQGKEGSPPTMLHPFTSDFLTSMTAAFAGLCGYINAQRTGKGQVVDVSMYESQAALIASFWSSYLNGEGVYPRSGNRSYMYEIFGLYQCKDNKWIAVTVSGLSLYKKLLDLLGLDIQEYTYDGACRKGDPQLATRLGAKWDEWLACYTAEGAKTQLLKVGIPVSELLDLAAAEKHPHWIARKNFIHYKDAETGAMIKDFEPVPHFSTTPGKVWRGGPALGQDTDFVLQDILKYSEEKIADLKAQKIVESLSK
jgi:crotonobetainyl-CoA:carnitine CoA-transferase CaiB-like acyl-CoA transferase